MLVSDIVYNRVDNKVKEKEYRHNRGIRAYGGKHPGWALGELVNDLSRHFEEN